ncbi:hypothetical protein, partial [Shewanella oncorhynchi]|uniref:hypothetical protein n=1 Tax=Shewanella oncorhynchi TaxID=2726434 RepID=UPI003D7BC036
LLLNVQIQYGVNDAYFTRGVHPIILGCSTAPSMGRTVVSQITMAHLFDTSVTCLYEGDTQHAFRQSQVRFLALIDAVQIKISMV